MFVRDVDYWLGVFKDCGVEYLNMVFLVWQVQGYLYGGQFFFQNQFFWGIKQKIYGFFLFKFWELYSVFLLDFVDRM